MLLPTSLLFLLLIPMSLLLQLLLSTSLLKQPLFTVRRQTKEKATDLCLRNKI
jgi:hypothetical protein